MIAATAVLLALVVLATGVVLDRAAYRHRWGAGRPGLASAAAHASAFACVASIAGIAAIVGHDVLEHLLVWSLHADKAELHQAYASGHAGGVVWNLVLIVPVTIAATVVGAMVSSRVSASRLRSTIAHLPAGSVRRRDVGGAEVLVVHHPTASAQCVSGRGRRGVIVVTTSAESVLSPVELDAVVEHERTHLRLRHHRSVMVAGGLARIVAPLGLLRRYPATVARLVELEADDVAASKVGGPVVAAALLRLSTGPAGRGGALAFAGSDTAHRIRRLLEDPAVTVGEDPTPTRSRWHGVLLTVTAAALPVLAVLWPAMATIGSAHG